LLLYGAELRLNEGLGLRIKDVDVERREIAMRAVKGGHDRDGSRTDKGF
jgi:site-specific recombinase XerC